MAEIHYWRIVLTALPLLAFIVNLSFGIFIFRRKRILVNRLFTLLMLAFCWWTIGEVGMGLASSNDSAAVMLKFINIATPCIPGIALAFVMALENKTPSRRQIAFMVIGSLIFIILDLAGWLVSTAPEMRFEIYMLPGGTQPMLISIYNGYVYFMIYEVSFVSYVIYRLLRFYRTCDNEMVKKRIRYLLVGALITALVTLITEFLVPLGLFPIGFDIPSLGSFSTVFLTSFTYYSVRSR